MKTAKNSFKPQIILLGTVLAITLLPLLLSKGGMSFGSASRGWASLPLTTLTGHQGFMRFDVTALALMWVILALTYFQNKLSHCRFVLVMGPSLALASDEVVARQRHLPALHQLAQLLIEEIQVQCFEGLKIVLSLRVSRCLLAAEEVGVQAEGQGTDRVRQQLDGQTVGKGGLPRGGGASNENQPHPIPRRGDLRGDVSHTALMQCLGNEDHLPHAPLLHGPVQGSYVLHLHGLRPFPVLSEYNCKPGEIVERG